MTLSPAFLDELRARTLLSALIARTLKLTKAGREFKACCPFHNEKTPSFYVNDEKGFYHCFGCQAHGDAISWMTDQRGLTFMDAVKELAAAAGMDVPAPDPRAQAKAERAAGLHDVMEAAQAWFAEQLGGIEGAAARDYLAKRGIDAKTLARFGFGFAPDNRGRLRSALKQIGNDKLVEAGLLIAPDDGNREPYDRFRGRVTFPIRDPRGRVIAFSARILGPGEPKYLNSPDTPLFDKGRTLFNYDKAAPASREAKRVIVVEGQMDVIALDQAGIAEAVAPLGTAMTEAQLGLLWRLSPAPILCFDGDAAGQRAAARAAVRALPQLAPQRSLAFVTLPAGQDPDDLIRSGGRAALEALLLAPEPLVDRLWRQELEAEPLTTPERRAGLRRRLMEHVSAIGDPDVRDQYRAEFLSRFDALMPRRTERTSGQRFDRRGPFVPVRPVSASAKQVSRAGVDSKLVRAVLRGLVRFPALIGEHADALAALPVAESDAAAVREALLEAAMTHAALDREALDTILAARGVSVRLKALRLGRGLAFSFTRRDVADDRARRDLALVIETLAARPGLEAALDAATARLKEAGDKAAFVEQQRLRAARDEADRRIATLIEGDGD
jgi:DNA primase